MALPPEKGDSRLMREMFAKIAPRYDSITRLLSYGMDGRWKRLGVDRAALPKNARILDLAGGTGDFSLLISQRLPESQSIVVDLTERMLQLARSRGLTNTVCADATSLSFADSTFDAVFVGYGLRNFPDLPAALREIERVTRSGGWLVSLDFFLPRNFLLREIFLAYLYLQGSLWGILLHGRPRVYSYISSSLRSFVSMDELSRSLRAMGYKRVDSRPFIFGGIGLHWAEKG